MPGHKIRSTMTHACIYALPSCGNISPSKKKKKKVVEISHKKKKKKVVEVYSL